MSFEKECNTCKIILTLDNFYYHKQNKNYFASCKKCYQIKKSARRKERKNSGELKYNPKKKKCIECDNLCDARKKILRCYSCSSKYQYIISEKRRQVTINLNIRNSNDQEYKQKISSNMKKLRKDDNFNKKLCDSLKRSGRLSKVHLRIKKILDLENLGFVSEQLVDKYFADELNENKKIIIEINGDYVHANPKFYKDLDIIKLHRTKYTAKEKWQMDEARKKCLESIGYRVFIIWESDDLEEKRKQLHELLQKKYID